jgi:hypothetical protein
VYLTTPWVWTQKLMNSSRGLVGFRHHSPIIVAAVDFCPADLYTPQVNLSQVVLPAGHLESVLAHCRAYDSYISYIGKQDQTGPMYVDTLKLPGQQGKRGEDSQGGEGQNLEQGAGPSEAAERNVEDDNAEMSVQALSQPTMAPIVAVKRSHSKKVAYGNGLVILLCGKSGKHTASAVDLKI